MHGMIFGELKKFVDTSLGGDAWGTLLDEAGLPDRLYLPIKEYPDEEVVALVTTASKITGKNSKDLLIEFGEFMAEDLLRLYHRQVSDDWKVMDLFEHLETTIHKVVRLRNPGATPPYLNVERQSSTELVITYTSARNMCGLGIGLIRGIAEQFGEPVYVVETTCMLHGDPYCTIKVERLERTSQEPIEPSVSQTVTIEPINTKPIQFQADQDPIVIIGTGPVGIHAARELLRQVPQHPIVIYGAEPWEPYNRVRLSELLSGEIEWEQIINNLDISTENQVSLRINTPIVRIDRENKQVIDNKGHVQDYSYLVLCTGSRAQRLDTGDKKMIGIYTYRGITDAQELMTNVIQSESIVIMGGGVLGIEVAFALKTQNPRAEVLIIHRGDRMMNRQLDKDAANFLLDQVHQAGIKVLLSTSVVEFLGGHALQAIKLDNGQILSCDTLVVCAGTIPNAELAHHAGLDTNRGIQVNDYMQTSDPTIYAVGECVEHKNMIYGLVAPGIEQATIAINNILYNNSRTYHGTIHSMRVKVKQLPIFALQKAETLGTDTHVQTMNFQRAEDVQFRQLMIKDGRLLGATAIGDWSEVSQVQEAIDRNMRVRPWHRFYFSRYGSLRPQIETVNPAQWSESRVVCTCCDINRGQISNAINSGCTTIEAVGQRTGAGLACGSCQPIITQLLGAPAAKSDAQTYKMPLSIVAGISWVFIILYGIFPPFTLPETLEIQNLWTTILFDPLWQQITGYISIGLILVSLIISFNKRRKWFQFASYNAWRFIHVVLATVAFVILMLHMNMSTGHHFNFRLAIVLLLAFFSGSVIVGLVATENRFLGGLLYRYRSISQKIHIYIFWVFIALVLVHIASVYYY